MAKPRPLHACSPRSFLVFFLTLRHACFFVLPRAFIPDGGERRRMCGSVVAAVAAITISKACFFDNALALPPSWMVQDPSVLEASCRVGVGRGRALHHPGDPGRRFGWVWACHHLLLVRDLGWVWSRRRHAMSRAPLATRSVKPPPDQSAASGESPSSLPGCGRQGPF